MLCCARTGPDSEQRGRIEALLQKGIDWPELLRLARRHGLMPLCYRGLSAACPGAVPAAVLARLRDLVRIGQASNEYRTGALLRLLRRLEAVGIPAVPFKGPVVAVTVYGDLGLRYFSDLDILIHAHDLPRTRGLLTEEGYQAKKVCLSSQQSFVHPASRLLVDLHWGIPLTWWSHIDPERWWERLVSVSLAGTPVRSFAPEEALLILCVNAAKAFWDVALKDFCDIAEQIRARPALDWGRVSREARRCRCQRLLFAGLHLANDLFGVPLPAEVRRRMKRVRGFEGVAATLRARLLTEESPPVRPTEYHLWNLQIMDALRDRLRYCGTTLLPAVLRPTERERALLPLPSCLAFLHYLLRPLRLARKLLLYLLRPRTVEEKSRSPVRPDGN